MCLEEETEIVLTMEVTKEMDSAINIATECENCNGGSKWNESITEMNFAMKQQVR